MPSVFPATLSDFTPRSLNLIASLFAKGGCDVRVALSERLDSLDIALENWTIVLNPKKTHLYDLALAASLLEHRADRKSGPRGSKRLDRWLTRQARKFWGPHSQKTLARAFPGIRRLPGRFTPGRDFDGLNMVDQHVEFAPLEKLPTPTDVGVGQVRLEMNSIPQLEIRGADGDTQWLLDSLESGSLPTQCIPGFEDLPMVVVPFRLCSAEAYSLIEAFEAQMNDPLVQESIPALMDCYIRKSENRDERQNHGPHTRDGDRLDMNRVLASRLAKRAGLPGPPRFRKKAQTFEAIFDGAQHLVVVCFDINDLQRKVGWVFEDPREAIQRLLVAMLTTYERLETDVIIIGVSDNLLKLHDGRTVLLHARTVVKSIDESFDVVWNRVAQLFNKPPTFPGGPSCFHPASLAAITQTFDEIAKTDDHSYRTVVWWARRIAHWEFHDLHAPQFMQRVADHVDREIANLEARHTGTLDTLASFLPSELLRNSQPGGYLAGIEV